MPITVRLFLAGLLAAASSAPAIAASAPFDLAGPGLQVAVTHHGKTLPIARVPNLATGDRVSIKLDLPKDQSAHYLLIAAFLRGATNPPPEDWFFRAKTWKNEHNDLSLTVPKGALQLVLFLVPDTGGAYDAIVDKVRKQPGTFVRASQELNQASLDRARLDTFVGVLDQLEHHHPDRIATASPVLTRSLSIKLKAECLEQSPDLQAACLTQNRESLLLADSHSSSLAETLAGAPTDLAFQLSATPNAGFGYYSPYIGVVRDIARIFGAFQSTHLQYIPALARAGDDRITLLLNAPPSFGKPTSVMVVAMPAVDTPQPPPLRRSSSEGALCAGGDPVFAVEGASLIYATHYAHDMMLRVAGASGSTVDVPVHSDATRGGYVLSRPLPLDMMAASTTARLHGVWGFAAFDGPAFRLENPARGTWQRAEGDDGSLVVGRDDDVLLTGGAATCVTGVELRGPSGRAQPVTWKAIGSAISATVPLKNAAPGPVTLLVHQRGVDQPQAVTLKTFAETGTVSGFTLHAGDTAGDLVGTRLDKVTALSVGKTKFTPGARTRIGDDDHLVMTAGDPAEIAALPAGSAQVAKVTLADGRTRTVPFTVAAPRPPVTLIGLNVARPAPPAGAPAIMLTGDKIVPRGGEMRFSFRIGADAHLSGGESVEVATADGRAATTVSARSGYAIQNDRIGVVTIDTAKAFGPSAYGPLRFRLIDHGVASDWVPLGTLVRMPTLTALACPAEGTTCRLSGEGLFLASAIGATSDLGDAVTVPDGFTATSIAVPRPVDGALYLRLRDDPAAVARVAVK